MKQVLVSFRPRRTQSLERQYARLMSKYDRLRHHVYKLDETLVRVLLDSHDRMKLEEDIRMHIDSTEGKLARLQRRLERLERLAAVAERYVKGTRGAKPGTASLSELEDAVYDHLEHDDEEAA